MTKKNDPNPVTNPSLIEAICSSGREKILPRPRPGLREFVEHALGDGWIMSVSSDGEEIHEPSDCAVSIMAAVEAVEEARLEMFKAMPALSAHEGVVLVHPHEGDDWLVDFTKPTHPFSLLMSEWPKRAKRG